jgi:hypothetical protein
MLSGLITDLQDLIFADSSCFIVTHDLWTRFCSAPSSINIGWGI